MCFLSCVCLLPSHNPFRPKRGAGFSDSGCARTYLSRSCKKHAIIGEEQGSQKHVIRNQPCSQVGDARRRKEYLEDGNRGPTLFQWVIGRGGTTAAQGASRKENSGTGGDKEVFFCLKCSRGDWGPALSSKGGRGHPSQTSICTDHVAAS